jgi:photosystem II PsbH protein
MYNFLYNSEIIFDFVNSTWVKKTALGSLLKAIGNSGQGKVVPGWGAVPVMTVIGLLLLVFLVILLQIYNQSLLLQGFSVDWNGN